jgi:hypothetical protein
MVDDIIKMTQERNLESSRNFSGLTATEYVVITPGERLEVRAISRIITNITFIIIMVRTSLLNHIPLAVFVEYLRSQYFARACTCPDVPLDAIGHFTLSCNILPHELDF